MSPGGLSAIAGIVTAVVTGVALLAGGGDGGGATAGVAATPSPTTTSAGGDAPADLISRTISGRAQLTQLLDEVALRELPEGGALGTFSSLASDDKVSAKVPADWAHQEVTRWLDGADPIGRALIAAKDETRFFHALNSPGVFLGVADELPGDRTAAALEKQYAEQLSIDCIEAASGELAGDSSKGVYSVWTRCGSTKSMTVFYVSVNDAGFATVAYFRLVHREDVEAVDRLLQTLSVNPPVGAAAPVDGDVDTIPGSVIE